MDQREHPWDQPARGPAPAAGSPALLRRRPTAARHPAGWPWPVSRLLRRRPGRLRRRPGRGSGQGLRGRRPAYRLSYREIILDPPPPPWFRGGSAPSSSTSWGVAGEFQTFSALNFDRGAAALLPALRLGRKGDGASRRPTRTGSPSGSTTGSRWRSSGCRRAERTVVDRDGVILPREDIDSTGRPARPPLRVSPRPTPGPAYPGTRSN